MTFIQANIESAEMWLSVMIGFFWYQVIAHVGISSGIHRYFAHKQFQAPVAFEWISLYMCVLAGARSPIGWIAAHRMHHADSDGPSDPHSPKNKGFLNILLSRWRIVNIPPQYAKDLFGNKRLLFFHRYWHVIWITSAALALALGFNFFLSFILLPALLSYIGFGLINSLCHRYGTSRDYPLINILVAGEGYHRSHHTNMGQYVLNPFDTTGQLLRLLIVMGVFKK